MVNMEEDQGLVASFKLDGTGRGQPLNWEGVRGWNGQAGTLWIHLNRNAEPAQRWLKEYSSLDALVVESLLAEGARPRCVAVGEGVMFFLRGVNSNPGADPEDMVSIRIWVEPSRIIRVSTRAGWIASNPRRGLKERPLKQLSTSEIRFQGKDPCVTGPIVWIYSRPIVAFNSSLLST